jgi:fatty-acyl-CoA synthase
MPLVHAETQGESLHGWKVLVGGAALPKAVAARALRRGIDVCCGYGMSETCPIVTTSHMDPHMEQWDIERQVELRCKAGRPVPLVELRIVDEGMNDVPHDGVSQGEIVLRAPWLTGGYAKDEGGSAALWRGGWLHTGDIGVVDGLGYVKIVDRLKDVIKSGGEWVSSSDLEDLIQKHSAVAEVAVIGVPDPLWIERPLAVVVVKHGHSLQGHELKAQLADLVSKGVISKYGVPDRVVFVDALPKTSVGKLDKKLLRQQYADENWTGRIRSRHRSNRQVSRNRPVHRSVGRRRWQRRSRLHGVLPSRPPPPPFWPARVRSERHRAGSAPAAGAPTAARQSPKRRPAR